SWAIGVILKVSENTVNFHVKNAMRKLETTSRTQCVPLTGMAFADLGPRPLGSRRKLMADVQEVVLSEREKQCLRWVEEGKSSWAIGVILKVSENTVNFHVKNAMRKLETTSRTQCVVKARRQRLI
ncbi:LuxR C-terminal-related transcriptional regulator, partial [Bradyrhizobium sp. DN5]|uniref:LuxR family transcriptional regulator n=1 Tax=Bradyrhizobium sp. DN5 TaxID=3056950 RepID=UPI00352597E3